MISIHRVEHISAYHPYPEASHIELNFFNREGDRTTIRLFTDYIPEGPNLYAAALTAAINDLPTVIDFEEAARAQQQKELTAAALDTPRAIDG